MTTNSVAQKPRRDHVLRFVRLAVRLAFVALFGVAGVQHLTDPTFFHWQYPSFLPAANIVIRFFGLLFLLGALGLLGPASVRRRATLGLIVVLLLIWPGNWWGALQPGSYIIPDGSNLIDWVRVPFQLVWIALLIFANRDELMAPLIIRARTTVPPTAVLAALTDFTPERPRLFRTLDPARYTVHDQGNNWAEVTEGARPPGPVERERYDWSTPGEVRIETLESTDFKPGSSWLYRISAAADGAQVELTIDRRPATTKGRVVTALGWFVGRAVLARDLQKTLSVVRAEQLGSRI